jgi:hypothetical protein
MDTKKIITEVAVILLVDIVLLKFIYQPYLRRISTKGKYYVWGNMLFILGVILTSFYVFIAILSLASPVKADPINFIIGMSPFLIVGIPSLIVGIILINNP